MRRKYRKLQKEMDEQLLEAIEQGSGSPAERREAIRPFFNFVEMGDIVAGFIAAEESATTQRLRREGLVEIGTDGIAKSSSQINPTDVDAIVERRVANEKGHVANTALFAHAHGLHDECRKQLRLYMVLFPECANVGEAAEMIGIEL